MPKQTPSQTIGPFFSFGLIAGGENDLVDERCVGERIYVEGRVLDGQGQPVLDALVEIWQADAEGIYNHPSDPRQGEADSHFKGFGRSETTDEGRYWFRTIKPGVVQEAEGEPQAPHINVCVFARGMLMHAYTRIYFEDEAQANEQDTVLNSIEDIERRQTLIARRETAADGLPRYCLDIVLQGEEARGETVFFDV
jgi:protocatechuate 3,4-dioxygenase alpha subunit